MQDYADNIIVAVHRLSHMISLVPSQSTTLHTSIAVHYPTSSVSKYSILFVSLLSLPRLKLYDRRVSYDWGTQEAGARGPNLAISARSLHQSQYLVQRSTSRDGDMVLRGRYIYGMEVKVDRTLVVDPRKTCALLFPVSSQILTASNYHSGFREERALVCYLLSCSPPRNLHRQLALQSSKT